ncbi:gas vesicle protein [Micromonospora qiuiae]|uniref:Gas vesicle protein n=1 Tax=Micromonospora qiuiae TaxID=502268 RepID=A0ABQ4JD82_9ACTN|nr:GvpL/GvpF family gas vesicle protein [Micromonospora qiuiae]GIJ28119.1 gas vesicle protein [Micromonospora qiuiae]
MAEETALFVYGIVPSDVEPTENASGVGDPPAEVTLIRQGRLAALVSEIPLDTPLGRPADLRAYQELLDGTAAVAPVLPVRFGTALDGPDGVTDLLATHQDRFAAALDELEGRVQYALHGRYREGEFVAAVLADNPAAADLAEQVRGQPEEVTREQRIRLGELISQAVELSREAETTRLLEALGPLAVASAPRAPSNEMDAGYAVFLVDTERAEEFIAAAEEYAEQRRDLIRARLLGPLAPYDFADAHELVG